MGSLEIPNWHDKLGRRSSAARRRHSAQVQGRPRRLGGVGNVVATTLVETSERKSKMEITISMDVEDLMSGFAYTYTSGFSILDAYRVYRNTFDKRKNELSRPGVYFLECGLVAYGQGVSQQTEKLHIYIGQSGNVFERLRSHRSVSPSGLKKESLEWKSAICFLNDKLTNNSLLDLEKSLFELFKDKLSSRFVIHTEKVSSKKVNVDKKLSDAIEEIRIYLAAMGINTCVEANIEVGGNLYSCKLPNSDKNAEGYLTVEKFIVKRGSNVSSEKKTNFKPDSYWKLRQELEDRGVIKNGRFAVDYEFRSASEAAAVVRGCSSNGQDVWKIHIGDREMSMKEFLNQ